MLNDADIIDTLERWLDLNEEADGLHAALPAATRSAIELNGNEGQVAHIASLPVADRGEAREVLVYLLDRLRGCGAVSGSQGCARRRHGRCPCQPVS